MGRIKDLNSALPTENDAFVFDGANGTKRLSYAEFKQKLIDDGFGSGSSEAVVLTQAEYDALPDEVKDSDTIFFISDAPFENSNVVTLTRAEYDALSDATKMDGRFYYITDEAEVTKSLVVQNNVNSTETVPSSAVVYGLKSDIDSQISNLLSRVGYVTFKRVITGSVGTIKLTTSSDGGKVSFLIFGMFNNMPGIIVCGYYYSNGAWLVNGASKLVGGASSAITCTISDKTLNVPVDTWGYYTIVSFDEFEATV